jgi:hypothetical protein
MSKTLKKFIQAELEGNLSVLIDPKKKDSFSSNRINVWSRLVSERIVEHLHNHLDSKKI